MERDETVGQGGVDLGTAGAAIRQQWLWIVLAVIVALIGAVIYLKSATFEYSVSMVVTPVQSGNTKGLAGQLGGLASLAGVDLPSDGGAAPFQLYVEGLVGRPVAAELARNRRLLIGAFPDDWNAETKRWRQPVGTFRGLSTAVKRLLGVPVYPWRAPDAARLQEYMIEHVGIYEKPKKPVVTVSLSDRDPRFGITFLAAMHAANDEMLRQRSLKRSDGYISYLTRRLGTEGLAEHRQALAAALSEQIKARMLASSGMAFAAEPFGPAVASLRPTSPRPLLVLAGAIAGGVLIGVLIAMLRYRREPVVNPRELQSDTV